jgi:hypothetical protein
MDVVEVVPSFEQYAFTFGGVAPWLRVTPATNLVVDGALTRGIQL